MNELAQAINTAITAQDETKVTATAHAMRLLADTLIEELRIGTLEASPTHDDRIRIDREGMAIVIDAFGEDNDYICEIHTPEGTLRGGFTLINDADADALDECF
jgi:hypothetical protein